MNLENFGEKRVKKPLHHTLLPDNIRMLIVGQFGYGKTNLVVNLTMKYITWSCLYVSISRRPKPRLIRGNATTHSGIFDDFMLEEDQTFLSLIFFRET